MSEILLADNSLVGSAFSDGGMVLFGIVLFLFGAILTLTILIKRHPNLFLALAGLLKVQLLLLLGIVVLDLSNASSASTTASLADLSAVLATHRFLIVQLPFLLLACAAVTLAVYRERIAEQHAHQYYLLTTISIWVSFAVLLLIGFESMV